MFIRIEEDSDLVGRHAAYTQARVNGGSNYDSLKVCKCLVIFICIRQATTGLVGQPASRGNEARVNGGSNYDSLKVCKCLVIFICIRQATTGLVGRHASRGNQELACRHAANK